VTRRRLRIGVLELLSGELPSGFQSRVYHLLIRRQFYSVMPQAVAAWCRRLGHSVSYATYYGQAAPERLLPEDLDIVFLSAFTEAAGLAYALAKVYRARKTRTVIGGPHAHAFPRDALRFFDIAVVDCTEEVVRDIVAGHYPPGSSVAGPRGGFRIPLLEERRADIDKARLMHRRLPKLSLVPLMSSTGCPYACNFCSDWNNPYAPRDPDDLRADLDFAAEAFPGQLLAFYDPNFGVNFDRTIGLLEGNPKARRNPFVVESSLSILKPHRLRRLRETNCVFVAPGIESWQDYGNKSATGQSRSRDKYVRVAEHFRLLSAVFPGLQANFIFGHDSDNGREPIELTTDFIRQFPRVFPKIAIPIAFGGTPLRDELKAQGRLLPLPPVFYFNPLPTLLVKNYPMGAFFTGLIEMFSAVTARSRLRTLALSSMSLPMRAAYLLGALDVAGHIRILRRFRDRLVGDAEMVRFNSGQSAAIPACYHDLLRGRLQRYGELLSRRDCEEIAGD
jgi:Radical SAM superfamily